MAANYWESTQRKHWQFTKEQLASMRQKLEDEDPNLVQSFGLPQLRHLNIFFNQREYQYSQADLRPNNELLMYVVCPVQKSTAWGRDLEPGSRPWPLPKSTSNASTPKSKSGEQTPSWSSLPRYIWHPKWKKPPSISGSSTKKLGVYGLVGTHPLVF